MKTTTKLWIGIGVLAVVSPLGVYLPEKLKSGAAWGEWGTSDVKELIGYVPHGLEKFSTLWHAIMPNYAFKGWEAKGMGQVSIAYCSAAVLGIAACVGLAFLLARFLVKKK